MEYNYQKMTISLRKKLVLSQMEMADKLGVSFASINRWETGKNEPTIKAKRKLISLCKKNGIPLYEKEEVSLEIK